MRYFEFYNPVQICAGDDALGNLKYAADSLGIRHPLLLTDETLTKLGLAAKFLSLTGLSNCTSYDRVPADSSVDTVNQIAKLYRDQGCDGIVALGEMCIRDRCARWRRRAAPEGLRPPRQRPSRRRARAPERGTELS